MPMRFAIDARQQQKQGFTKDNQEVTQKFKKNVEQLPAGSSLPTNSTKLTTYERG